MTVVMIGIDLGKNSCSVAALDESGAVVFRRRMRPTRIVEFAAKYVPCTVAMEACCGAHLWRDNQPEKSYCARQTMPRSSPPPRHQILIQIVARFSS